MLPPEGAGNAGRSAHPQPRVQRKAHELETTVTPESPGIPRAMVLTVSFVLFPVTGLCCHRHLANYFRELDASVGASEPHDFAVRKAKRLRQCAARVHRIPRRVRDDREPPLCGDGTARDMQVIWVRREWKNFCEGGWTHPDRQRSVICPSGQARVVLLRFHSPIIGARCAAPIQCVGLFSMYSARPRCLSSARAAALPR